MKKSLAEELRSYANILNESNINEGRRLTAKSLDHLPQEADNLSAQGTIDIAYEKLVRRLGPSLGPSDDGKVTQQWVLQFSDGEFLSIHDWKERSTPMGPSEWTVSARNQDIYYRIVDVLYGGMPVEHD